MDSTNVKSTQRLFALLAALIVLVPAADAFAEKDQAVDSGAIVRRKLLYRSTRVEITPAAGMTLNDAFRRNYIGGAGFNYHLTNEFGIGVSGGYGVLHSNTDLSNNINATAPSADNISYAEIQWLADFTLSYVPIFGKFSLFKSATIPYDLHLLGGLTVVNEVGTTPEGNGTVDAEVEGIRPGGVVGGGVRLFLSDMLSVNFDTRTLFISRAPISSGSANAELKPTVYATLGVGIFFPSTVKISR
jgi:outer membrane beta-barrel protein